MHKPPHSYTIAQRRGVHLPENDRWACVKPPNEDGHPWCGVKHTAQRYADRHCETLNKDIPGGEHTFLPAIMYRTERYSSGELHYRGWTEEMIDLMLGEADAEDSGHKYVYEPRLYDADRVHDAEVTPRFDRMAAQAQSKGMATTFEEDFTAILQAVSQDIHLEIPSIDRDTLISYARNDLQRMSDEKTARKKGLSVKRNLQRIRNLNGERYLDHPEDEALAHAADRCCGRSKPSYSFFRRYRRHHMAHTATEIFDARLASAVHHVAPVLREHLIYGIKSPNTGTPYLEMLPIPGKPLPWEPAVRIDYRTNEPLPQKFHNLTNLRWAKYRSRAADPPKMPPWGVVTVTTADGSLTTPFRWQPPLPADAPPEDHPTEYAR